MLSEERRFVGSSALSDVRHPASPLRAVRVGGLYRQRGQLRSIAWTSRRAVKQKLQGWLISRTADSGSPRLRPYPANRWSFGVSGGSLPQQRKAFLGLVY